jgi:ribonuclease-3
MSDPLSQLEVRIGHAFRNRAWLECAVTHPSLLPERPELAGNNQRLEFLGDAVLQLVLTEELFRQFPTEREGLLSKRRAALAKGAFLARLAQEIGLGAALRMGASEETSGGRHRAAALEDALEALIGALYLDTGLEETRRIVLALYGNLDHRLAGADTTENPKGQLQERVQPAHGNTALRYEVVGMTGEDHAREYQVTVYLLDRELGTGRGTSKKQAEEAAARAALQVLTSPDQPGNLDR